MRSHGSKGEKELLLISWTDVAHWVKDIVDLLVVAREKPDAILAIGRGGLIPAAMIVYLYGKRTGLHPSLDVVYASSYGGVGEQGDLVVGHIPAGRALALKRHNILIVDDIADTGATLDFFLEKFKEARTAVLIHKTQSSVLPDYYGHQDKAGKKYWYTFPWEHK